MNDIEVLAKRQGLRIQELESELAALKSPEWTPTADNINALPEPIRSFNFGLETRCDPAGDVAALTIARDQLEQLQAKLSQSNEAINSKLLEAAIGAKEFLDWHEDPDHHEDFRPMYAPLESAIAAASAQAEDDAMPLDADWLASVGFDVCGGRASLFPIEMDTDGENCFLGFNFNVRFDLGDTFTRGEVRRLLAVLGIQPSPSLRPSGSPAVCAG